MRKFLDAVVAARYLFYNSMGIVVSFFFLHSRIDLWSFSCSCEDLIIKKLERDYMDYMDNTGLSEQELEERSVSLCSRVILFDAQAVLPFWRCTKSFKIVWFEPSQVKPISFFSFFFIEVKWSINTTCKSPNVEDWRTFVYAGGGIVGVWADMGRDWRVFLSAGLLACSLFSFHPLPCRLETASICMLQLGVATWFFLLFFDKYRLLAVHMIIWLC